MYSDVVMEHFRNPRNIGVIDDANVVVKVGDPSCGDALLVFLKIDNDRVQDVKYKIFGCGAAIATSSIASEMAMGKTLDEVLAITDQDITDALQGLPVEKWHCSNLAASAFHAAIKEYRKKTAGPSADFSGESPS
ncbi:MAG TPA: iron-sulfur cluster assembly scaffold protein [Desulfuromonadales bacterium]|nr:iron-sulfur cluster assembly scaffold protein [Desulfuromonadales bacterium]